MSAGYSGTPLAKKLGIKAGASVALVQPPEGFVATLEGLPERVSIHESLRGKARFDVLVWFPRTGADLRRRCDAIARRITSAGGLWIAWPKKTSGMQTDLSDATVRAIGLNTGLVDNKVCAISEVYSGLRFVVRVADRG